MMHTFLVKDMDLAALDAMLDRIALQTGAIVEKVAVAFELHTSDERAAAVLNFVLDAPVSGRVKVQPEADPEEQTEQHVFVKREPWELLGPDKSVVRKFSIDEKQNMLGDGKFELGAIMRYAPNGKLFSVAAGKDKAQRLVDKVVKA